MTGKHRNKSTALPSKEQSLLPLYSASFLCGTAVMVLEMAGSRLLAPYLGTSLIVWTSLIGVVMASLSLGYWLGGIVADRFPKRTVLAATVLCGGGLVALMGLFSNSVLSLLTHGEFNLYGTSLVASLLLFALPGVLLGMVSPFIVRLALSSVESSGRVIGRFSALSSTGSILGTFLGGFVLVSLFSTGTILLLVAGVLAFVAAMLLGFKSVPALFTLALCLVLFSGAVYAHTFGLPGEPEGIHIDSAYNHIVIQDSYTYLGRPVRLMQTDPNGAQSVMYCDNPSELASDYTQFYDLAFYYRPSTSNVLMLGGGAYCVPRHLLATRPFVSVDVVELDPGITQAARDHFYLQDSPNLTIRHEDARLFLNREAERRNEGEKYDAIFGDVFGSWYSIPFQMTTVECMQRVFDLLREEGVFIINVISPIDGEGSGILRGIYSGLAQVFPTVKIFPASFPDDRERSQNIMLVAIKSPKTLFLPSPSGEMRRLLSHELLGFQDNETAPFTDAFAPIERYYLNQ